MFAERLLVAYVKACRGLACFYRRLSQVGSALACTSF